MLNFIAANILTPNLIYMEINGAATLNLMKESHLLAAILNLMKKYLPLRSHFNEYLTNYASFDFVLMMDVGIQHACSCADNIRSHNCFAYNIRSHNCFATISFILIPMQKHPIIFIMLNHCFPLFFLFN